jgi:hypothetical protein
MGLAWPDDHPCPRLPRPQCPPSPHQLPEMTQKRDGNGSATLPVLDKSDRDPYSASLIAKGVAS